MLRLLSFLAVFYFSLPAPTFAKTFDPQSALAKLPNGADAALLVVDHKTQQIIYSQNAEQLRPPASVQKLVTALAARLYLGESYQFETSLETHQDDIILRFTGDPTLTRDDIKALVHQLKSRTDTIKGNVYLNGAAFDEYEHAIGLPWDILGVCYSAPASSITLDANCIAGKLLLSDAAPDKTTVLLPPDVPIHAENKAIVIADTQGNHCELKLSANNANHYKIGGCVENKLLPLQLNFAVQDTTAYAAKILFEELQLAGIKLGGRILRNDDITGDVVASHFSRPLKELLEIMVKDSDNLIADNLAKTLGRMYFKQPGSFENGVAAMKAILKTQANIDLDEAVMVDGSGLSRNNRMNAAQIMQIVRYIFKHGELGLVQALPVSGESGTLLYRSSISTTPLKGQIAAKSGSLYGTYNLAGMLKTKSGQSLLFVQLVSNYHLEHDKHDGKPIMQFERMTYDSLFNNF